MGRFRNGLWSNQLLGQLPVIVHSGPLYWAPSISPFSQCSFWHLCPVASAIVKEKKVGSGRGHLLQTAMAMAARRFLQTLVANRSSCSYDYGIISRSIASSPRLESMGWFDKIKSAVTGKGADPQPDSFSLICITPLIWTKLFLLELFCRLTPHNFRAFAFVPLIR